MERALQKLARQLNQYDAASLAALWDRYAHVVARFEPTQRWEEAALVFSMIQSVHWKNQLFNAEMLKSQAKPAGSEEADRQLKERLKSYAGGLNKPTGAESQAPKSAETESLGGSEQKKRRKILLFPARDRSKS
ncbi:hypothetical protein LJC48_07090 [Desulfovibrio sp. OttesenSCG-928-C06]|nr:hypothetical protein [Desulfovibrio sp. OttesenSCG-928-C06]